MMTPVDLSKADLTHSPVRRLHDFRGVYACCMGLLRPWVAVDRKAETMPGFDALMHHESLHAAEWHALLGVAILLLGALEFAASVAFGFGLGMILGPVSSIALYVLWRREQEIRADAIALGAFGLAEYRNFLRLHPHDATRMDLTRVERAWGAWKYGRTLEGRERRAVRRCRRLRWHVKGLDV